MSTALFIGLPFLLAFVLLWPVFFRRPAEDVSKTGGQTEAAHGLPASQAIHAKAADHKDHGHSKKGGLVDLIVNVALLILAAVLIYLAYYLWSYPQGATVPSSEATMEHIMAPRHDTGWSRAVPIPQRTAHYQCPAKGPQKACSDYNTDMAQAPFLMQCQKTPGGVFEDWSMEACKGVHAFRLKSKSDQPVRVGYWFEPIGR